MEDNARTQSPIKETEGSVHANDKKGPFQEGGCQLERSIYMA